MKKFGKRLLIFLGFVEVLYGAYMVFMMPSGYVNKTDVVNGYITNLSSEDVCEKHFNEETQDHCDSMTTLLKDHVVVVNSAVVNGDKIIFRTMIGFPNGTNIMQEKIVKDFDKSDGLGFEMAKLMIDNGALELLKRAEETAFKDEMPQRL